MADQDQEQRDAQFAKTQEAVKDMQNPERANSAQELLDKMGVQNSETSVDKSDQENSPEQEYERD